jgi:hypothetical protein
VDIRFTLDYYDYREATTSGRIKGSGSITPVDGASEGRR